MESYLAAWNKHDVAKLADFYADDYVDANKATKKVILEALDDFFKAYPDVTASDTVTALEVNGERATITRRHAQNGHAASAGLISSEPGEMKGESESVLQLRKTDDGWKVQSEKKLSEDSTISFGQGKNLKVTFDTPASVKPGATYSSKMEIAPTADTLMGSIVSRIVKHPLDSPVDSWRPIQNHRLERAFEANSQGFNERVEGTVAVIEPGKGGIAGLKHVIRLVVVGP
jgi:ketosteroid isomerase-like protein